MRGKFPKVRNFVHLLSHLSLSPLSQPSLVQVDQRSRRGDDGSSSSSDIDRDFSQSRDGSLENQRQDNGRSFVGSLTGDEESDDDQYANSLHLNAKRGRDKPSIANGEKDLESMSLNSSTASSSAPSEPSNNPAPRKTARPSSPNGSVEDDDHEDGAGGDAELGSHVDLEEDPKEDPNENDKAMFHQACKLIHRIPANIAAVPPPSGDTSEINRALVTARDIVPNGSSAHTVAETAITLLHGQADNDAMVAVNFGPGGVHQRTSEYLNQFDRLE